MAAHKKAAARLYPLTAVRLQDEARRVAAQEVTLAIADGRLVRQPCEQCGRARGIEAHHDDYTKALDVRWLCRKCHRAWHREHGGSVVTGQPYVTGRRRNKRHVASANPGQLVTQTTERLRAICEAIGINESKLADHIGCSRQMVSIWFSGGFRTLKSINAVCVALNLEMTISFKPKARDQQEVA